MNRRTFLLFGLAPIAAACSGGEPSSSPTGGFDGGLGGSPDGGPDASSSQWRSALYPESWTPGFKNAEGRFLHDVSYAGYHYGEPPPSAVPGKEASVLDFGADAGGVADSTAAFVAAIEAASQSGGVVVIPPGDYRLDENLHGVASGVVLRGAGAEMTRMRFTRATGMTGESSITFTGDVIQGSDIPLVEDGAALASEVRVADASMLKAGDDIAIGWVISEEFVAEHGMTGTWTEFLGDWKPVHRRTIVSVDLIATPHKVIFDVPLRYPVKLRDGGSVRVETGYLSECGVEGVSITNAIDEDAAWSFNRAHAVSLRGVKDGWVRGVTTHAPAGLDDHLMSGGVEVAGCKRVTVMDTAMRRAQNRGGGGNGYLFEVSASCEVLFRDCIGESGRHNFIQNWDFGATGCVFLRCVSRGGKSFTKKGGFATTGLSEFHHSLAMANLIDDCVADDGWQGVNRGLESSGAGHSATECIFWRLRGEGRLRSYQAGVGYVIGADISEVDTTGEVDLFGAFVGTEPIDFVEGTGQGGTLVPVSLYEDQRSRRLGGN